MPKRLIGVGIGLVAVAAIALFLLRERPRAVPPNIILISIDTLRADRLGCYGCPVATSPHIDALSRESVQFMNVLSQAPSTAPSHMSLFTGLLPPVHRVAGNMFDPELVKKRNQGLSAAIPTLAQYLRENGYRTAGFHGGGNVSAVLGFDRGFDYYARAPWETLKSDPLALKSVDAWLQRSKNPGQPFFLFLHHYICHDPYFQAPPEFYRRFLASPVPGLQEKLEKIAVARLGSNAGFKAIRSQWWAAIATDDPAHRRHVFGLYDGGVNYADYVLGEMIDFFKKKHWLESSLIIVTSDHGEQFWEHGGTGHARWLFIETLHVPLLIRFPQAKYGGRKVDDLVGLFDVMPTLLDYLRIRPRFALQAASLLPAIRGERCAPRPIYSFFENLRTFRVGFKNFAYSNHPHQNQPELLFDRSRDPGEQSNLVEQKIPELSVFRDMAAQVRRGNRAVLQQLGGARAVTPALPDELKKQLESLGYL